MNRWRKLGPSTVRAQPDKDDAVAANLYQTKLIIHRLLTWLLEGYLNDVLGIDPGELEDRLGLFPWGSRQIRFALRILDEGREPRQ